MATLRDQLLEWYNKIPYNQEIDPLNLNLELVEIMLQSEELRMMFSYASSWSTSEFEKIAGILKKYDFKLWEVLEIIETYSPLTWEQQKAVMEPKIAEIMNTSEEQENDVFNLVYDLYPFRVSKNGIEIFNKNSDEEDYTTITETPIIVSATGTNLDDDSFLYQCTYRNIIGAQKTKWVTPSQLLTSDLKELVDLGLHLNDSDFKHMKAYFKKTIKHSSEMPREYTAKKTGWKKDNSIFIIGDYSYTCEGKRPIIPIDDTLSSVYIQNGNREQWIKVMTPMLDYDLTRIKCYAVVSAIILKLIDAPAFVLHNYYESSGSKTLTMKIAASLIGDPERLCRDSSISEVGLEKAASLNTDTALFFDETTKTPEFGKMVYTLVNGRGKTRGTVSNNEVGLAKTDTWKNVTLTTGEYTLTQYLSTATGITTRVIEIYEGIPTIDENYIRDVEETVSSHYGFFLDDILKVILESKQILKTRYNKIRNQFEKASTSFAARKKNYFAALTLAGQILENVFQKYGIPHKNPFEICEKYYISTSLADPTIPYYEKALETVYSWHIRNKRSFEYSSELDPDETFSVRGNVEIKGWVTPTGIIYEPDMLRKYLEEKGLNFDRAIKDWSDKGILIRRKDGMSWKYDTTIKGKKVRGVYIKFEKFHEILRISKDDLENKKNDIPGFQDELKEIKNEERKSRVGLRKACVEFLTEKPTLKNVTHTDENVAKEYVNTEKGSECLLYWGFQDIVSMFSKLKQGI